MGYLQFNRIILLLLLTPPPLLSSANPYRMDAAQIKLCRVRLNANANILIFIAIVRLKLSESIQMWPRRERVAAIKMGNK